MNLRLLSFFAAGGLFLTGCAEKAYPTVGGSIIAIMENDETRTSVTDDGIFTWSENDQVWLHTTNGGIIGTLSSGAGTPNANFSYGAFIGDMTGKGVYPYNDGHSISDNKLSFVLPSSYDLGSDLTNNNAAMYGVNVGGTVWFKHLAGVMRFKFQNVPAGTDKFQITLDKKINGIFTADLSEAIPIIETSDASSESERTVTLNFDALKSVSDIYLYVPLPVGTYNTLGINLWAGNKSIWSYSNTVTNKIRRKTLKLMPNINLGGSVNGDLEGSVTNLSKNFTANCYIVSEAGSYKFTPTKGNSGESVGAISSVEVLWESFGTNEKPIVGTLVKNVKYEDEVISFETPSTFNKGNAVIAAKDASSNILWSWHIWLTDQPEGQAYYNNAGTMMDRNLGATSATPITSKEICEHGLLYQWGRKDPFLSAGPEFTHSPAYSTITWPSIKESDSVIGTIEYSIANPTTFIFWDRKDDYYAQNFDWYYTESATTDDTRWTTSEHSKSMYDPCPIGWRVPDGGIQGVWSKAISSSSTPGYDYSKYGWDLSDKLGPYDSIWYPNTGIYASGGQFKNDSYCYYWSASTCGIMAYAMGLGSNGYGGDQDIYRAYGLPIRCIKE